jgi:hypothetical protein
MKLRILGNSIRLRLTRSDVAQFGRSGRVEETFGFGAQPADRLNYSLERSPSGTVELDVTPNRIAIRVPHSVANDWVETRHVGFEAVCRRAVGDEISVLVEKDFQCTHGSPNDPDRYPNPRESGMEKSKCG